MEVETADTEKQVVTLFGSHGFPRAVAFINAAETAAQPHGSFAFGISKKNAADALRHLADAFEADVAYPQKVSHTTHATNDDFVMHHVTVSFSARRP